MNIDKQLKQIVETIIEEVNTTIQGQINDLVQEKVASLVKTIPMQSYFNDAFSSALQRELFEFPADSIPAKSVQLANLKISGDQVSGGIIANFGSTGIDDQATACQLTILDNVTVVENNLLTRDLTVKGTVSIEGDLIVTGNVPEDSALFVNLVRSATNNVRTSLDTTVFQGYADLIFQQIKQNGIDLSKITVNGQDLVNGPTLSNSVINSNLQKVGVLKELQVNGETLLADTFYASGKRVGINTLQPAQALDIWDQEVEIGLGKLEKNVATINVPRNQELVIGSNGNRNITVLSDGSVTMNRINLGTIAFYSSDLPPAKDEPKGTIVFNANPTIGGPLGWVSLGSAKWANFGFID